jgi:AraC-like DNA-binding protein
MLLAPRLLSLLPNPLLHARLERALAAGARRAPLQWSLHPVRSWSELTAELRSEGVEALVADPYCDLREGQGMDELRWTELAQRAPDVVVIAYGEFPRYPARDVLRLAAAGVHEVVTAGVDDDAASFYHLLAGAAAAVLARRVVSRLGERLDPRLARLFETMLGSVHLPLTPDDAARLYHAHPKTLNEHLRRSALPPLGQLITWCRLLRAAQLLGAPRVTLERTARRLSFPSAAALRAQLSRYLGVSPSELRKRGGAAWAADEFCRRCGVGEWGEREGV